MKSIKNLIITLMLVFISTAVNAKENNTPKTTPDEKAIQMKKRVQEIWEMDFSDMEKGEKLEIKRELKEMKRELKTSGLDTKVSISVGAIIIILLLIIIIA